ncbi:TIGR02391 family protein [Nonomuraea sp. NPDC049709]|uniref:TIGR02391 family protein n=1 Tax=Nonomuraea sp. NPDC049709 TaxID=3154736 RepID=UPI00343A5484
MSEKLTLIRHGANGEEQIEVYGAVQENKALFGIDADVEEGDLIEKPLPSGKTKRYKVVNVTYHNAPGVPAHAHHVTASIETVRTHAQVSRRRVELPGLHPKISDAAGALFADGHYSRAVLAAFQAVEHEVQQKAQLNDSGVSLMHKAFGSASPPINVARHTGRNAQDEQEGFRFLFVGAMGGLRNPRAHGVDLPDSEQEALEYLAFASALMRRL